MQYFSSNAASFVSCKKGVPSDVEDLIFKSEQFMSPMLLELPQDLSEKQESSYRNALRNSGFLPPLPPAEAQLDQLNPDLKVILRVLILFKSFTCLGCGAPAVDKFNTSATPKKRQLIAASPAICTDPPGDDPQA